MPQKIGINISGYYAWYWYDTLNALWSLRMSVNCHPMGSNTLKYCSPCHAIKTQQSRVVQKEGGGSMWSQCQPAKHLSPHVTLSFEVTYYSLWHPMIGWLSAEELINTVSTPDCSTCITPSPTQSVSRYRSMFQWWPLLPSQIQPMWVGCWQLHFILHSCIWER